MNEELQKQLIRQLKLLNFWITFFGVTFLIALVVLGFLLFKVITFARDTSDRITNLQQKTEQSLDVKQQICDSSLFQKSDQLCN